MPLTRWTAPCHTPPRAPPRDLSGPPRRAAVSPAPPSFFLVPEATSGPRFEALKGSTPSSRCLWVWRTAGAPRCRLKHLLKLTLAVPLLKKPFPTWQTPKVSFKTWLAQRVLREPPQTTPEHLPCTAHPLPAVCARTTRPQGSARSGPVPSTPWGGRHPRRHTAGHKGQRESSQRLRPFLGGPPGGRLEGRASRRVNAPPCWGSARPHTHDGHGARSLSPGAGSL